MPEFILFGVIIIVAIILLIKFSLQESDMEMAKKNEKRQKLEAARKEEKDKYNHTINEFVCRFGDCTIDINLGDWNEHRIDKRFLVFEMAKIIIINSVEYRFGDILGFTLVDDATNETITTSTGNAKTSTGSMIGRAVVGGVLTGGLGAVAGAATAKKNISTDATSQTKTKHNYTLHINVNSIKDPIISLRLKDKSDKAQKIAALLNVIIERNKANYVVC